ncbi:MAG TPA: tRNA (adenosine(37)-N6)-threonylcarbamoyltransferase complex ATPase subunit type 1 TsaE [Pirellulaceae bacterium]|jgi:tRNA threonylcarbamoyladenosine biosynthesis protein TsaE
MMEFVFDAADEVATTRFGAALARVLPPGITIALIGTLGAGKTLLVQALAEATGIQRKDVVSPTFVLCQQYRGQQTINHVDAYRLQDEDEFRELGGDELMAGDAITIIEWADRVANALPDDYLLIEISVEGPTERQFVVRAIGDRYQGIIAELARVASGQ